MIWKDLGIPSPHPEPKPYAPIAWPETDAIIFDSNASEIQSAAKSPEDAFSSLIEKRRTRYGFGTLSLKTLGELLRLCCKVRLSGSDHLGFPLSQRSAPSAGAIHPIHIVVNLPNSPTLHRYEPFAHALIGLNSSINAFEMRVAMNGIVDGGDGVLIMFVAEPGLTFAKYENASSLVWRDSGVLQGYFSMAATALGLHFVLLGVTGEPWASHLTNENGLAGVGVAFVGEPPIIE